MLINESFPQKPGVYLLKGSRGEVIYIGKAINLRSRLKSHFSSKLMTPRVLTIMSQVKDIDYILTQSDFEALLLESSLIKKFKPRLNVHLKDDKHFLYVKITTSEEFPKVTTSRREDNRKALYFGPFPSAKKTREVLKIVRRIYPFCSQKTLTKRGCFFSYLGLCQPCPSNIVKLKGNEKIKAKEEYRHNISQIVRILKGESIKIIQGLEREMREKVSRQLFEEAAKIRDKIFKLKYIITPREKIGSYLEDSNFLDKKVHTQLDDLFKLLSKHFKRRIFYPHRIEGYDVSNISGKWATAAMVVFVNGQEEKEEYRRFKIKLSGKVDDVLMLKEVVGRRLSHPEWKYPQLILVDGGKPQVSAALKALAEKNLKIPVLGLAKKREEMVIPYNYLQKKSKNRDYKILKLPIHSPALNLVKAIRDEAHRFARNYHLKLRLKSILPSKITRER